MDGLAPKKKFEKLALYNMVINICSFIRLFVKLPRSGDSEVTFAVFRVKLPHVITSLTKGVGRKISRGGNGKKIEK